MRVTKYTTQTPLFIAPMIFVKIKRHRLPRRPRRRNYYCRHYSQMTLAFMRPLSYRILTKTSPITAGLMNIERRLAG